MILNFGQAGTKQGKSLCKTNYDITEQLRKAGRCWPMLWSKYLILGLRTSPILDWIDDLRYVVDGAKAVLRWVPFCDGNAHGMLLLTTKEPVELHEALGYAHGVEVLMSLVPFCSHTIPNDFVLLPLPDTFEAGEFFTFEQVLQEARSEVAEFWGDITFFERDFKSGRIMSTDWLRTHGKLLCRFFDEDDFERSCSYLHKSIMDLGVDKCDWREKNYDQAFFRFVTIANAESAFLNAFKAVEAFVGEPSENRTEEKLRERLARRSISADEPVGYSTKRTVLEWILLNHPLRDSIAGHGIGRQKRPLTVAEIIELQAVARYLILASTRPSE